MICWLSVHFLASYLRALSAPGVLRKTRSSPACSSRPTRWSSLPPRSRRDLPKTCKNLRVFARPPVTFYLSQCGASLPIQPQPSLGRLLRPAGRRNLGVARHGDGPARRGIERAEPIERSTDWILVRAIPTSLNLPTLLDIDPSVARAESRGPRGRSPLFRPKRAGEAP